MTKRLLFLLILSFLTSTMTMAQGKDEQLLAAVQKNEIAHVEALLNKKADPNFIKQVGPWMKVNPLITAVNDDNVAMVTLLLKHKAQVDWRDGFNTTALMYAASKGNMEITTLLIAHGADVNASDEQGNSVYSAARESGNATLIALIESKQGKQR